MNSAFINYGYHLPGAGHPEGQYLNCHLLPHSKKPSQYHLGMVIGVKKETKTCATVKTVTV